MDTAFIIVFLIVPLIVRSNVLKSYDFTKKRILFVNWNINLVHSSEEIIKESSHNICLNRNENNQRNKLFKSREVGKKMRYTNLNVLPYSTKTKKAPHERGLFNYLKTH